MGDPASFEKVVQVQSKDFKRIINGIFDNNTAGFCRVNEFN